VFTGEETRDWGLWNGVVATDDVLASARATARSIATGVSPDSIVATKRQLYADLSGGVEASLVEARRLLVEMMTGADYREGVAALLEKRPPKF
jgi:enoyl-CoA hydratase/carnithine racemase